MSLHLRCKHITMEVQKDARYQKFLETLRAKRGHILSDYVNYSTKVWLKCEHKHHPAWDVTPNHVVNDNCWCPPCRKEEKISKGREKFLRVIREKQGELMSTYVNVNTHVMLRCHMGHIWIVTPHSISGIMRSWCPGCSGNCPKLAAANFYAKVRENEGTVLGVYTGAYNRVRVRCINDHEWDCVPHSVTASNTWCAKCKNVSKEQACEKFMRTVHEKGGIVLGVYVNSSTRVRVRCKNGHEWDSVPGGVNYGDWCRACAGTCPMEAYKRLVKIVIRNEGLILGTYVNSYTKLLFQCKNGHQWETCPDNILNSKCWCPGCKESSGERTVRLILTKYGIDFKPQRTHPNLHRRFYDFHFTHNGKEFYLEYDGRQHFDKIYFFDKTEEDFQHKRAVDVLKSQTVLSAGQYLIRIDCLLTDEEIESHILTAINGDDKLYLSNPGLYQWITDALNPTQNTQVTQPAQPKQLTLNIMQPNIELIQPRVPANAIMHLSQIITSQPRMLTLNILPITKQLESMSLNETST